MSDLIDLWEKPTAPELYMIVGWRQWADAGSISSGLPRYLTKLTQARQIGTIRPDNFYLFQIPGTHDLVRPVIKFKEGFPEALDSHRNELYYVDGLGENGRIGLIFLRGDEPHLNIELYANTLLQLAQELNVRRIVGLGGVYGELPYDKERMVSAIYSLPSLKDEVKALAVNLSDYHGGASIGSYLCRRAGERDLEYISFYAFVPTYDFSQISEIGNNIRLENDFMAWLGVMKRINYMLKLNLDLSDLQGKSDHLLDVVDTKLDELDNAAPQMGVREYMINLSEAFDEVVFEPLASVWEEELDRLFDDE
jgi:predicted ATP-grasp superfamily ATP-dependent carboligase